MSEKDLESHIAAMNKKYGESSIIRLTDAPKQCDVISTGSLMLDRALGIGGIPRGRFTEIFGGESSGKTTLGYHICANAQKEGFVYYIDAEQSMDFEYAQACGFDPKKAIFTQPENAEHALGLLRDSIESGLFPIIVIDSVAALVPKAELEGEVGDAHVGLQPRLMSQVLRMTANIANQNNTAVVFINQVREKIGVMWGNPETTSGGRALKFYASVRLRSRIKERIGAKDDLEGVRIEVIVEKNKLAPPYKRAEMEILFGKGINKTADAIAFGVESGIIEKKGAWLVWGDQKWQGEKQLAEAIDAGGYDKFVAALKKAEKK